MEILTIQSERSHQTWHYWSGPEIKGMSQHVPPDLNKQWCKINDMHNLNFWGKQNSVLTLVKARNKNILNFNFLFCFKLYVLRIHIAQWWSLFFLTFLHVVKMKISSRANLWIVVHLRSKSNVAHILHQDINSFVDL